MCHLADESGGVSSVSIDNVEGSDLDAAAEPVIANESLLAIAKPFCHFMFQFPLWFQYPFDFTFVRV